MIPELRRWTREEMMKRVARWSWAPAFALGHAHISPPPLRGRAIAFGNDVPFFLSPRGEEGTQRVSDGKVRGSFRRRGCFRKQRESGAPPSPSRACGAGPPERLSKGLSPMGRGEYRRFGQMQFPCPLAREVRVG